MDDQGLRRYVDSNLQGVPDALRKDLVAWLAAVRDSLAAKGYDPDAVSLELVRQLEQAHKGPLFDLADPELKRELETLAGRLKTPPKAEAPPDAAGPLKALAAKVKAARLQVLASIAALAGSLGIAGEEAFGAMMDDLSEGTEEKPPAEKPPEEKPPSEAPPTEPPDMAALKAKLKVAFEETKTKTFQLANELQMDTGELSNLFQDLEEGMAPKTPQAPQTPEAPAAPESPAAPEAAAPGAPAGPETPAAASVPASVAILLAAKEKLKNALEENKNKISALADELDLDKDEIDKLLSEL